MSPVPAPEPVTPGGGGHPSTLYDATTDHAALVADDDALTISDSDTDFVSHGKLAHAGFTSEGHVMPTWFAPNAEAWDDLGWFAFDYDPDDEYVTQHWGFGPDEGASIRTGSAKNQMNLFATATQFGEDGNGALLIGWDSDGKRRASIGPYIDVDTWQIALYDPTMGDDVVTSYTVVANGNSTMGVSGNYGVGGSVGYTEMGSGDLGAGGSYISSIAQIGQTTPLLNLLAENGSTPKFLVYQSGHILTALPIADPHVSGELWNNAGAVKVSAG